MSDACRDILQGRAAPEPATRKLGRAARIADHGFHECPYPAHTADALSWRIGWNEQALHINDGWALPAIE